MCFPGPSKNIFFHSQDRSRTPKSRRINFFGSFLAPPWILRGPQNHPKSAKWRQKAPKIIPSLLLELSWNPFPRYPPRTLLGIIFNDFGRIFNEFQHSFWSFFIIIPSSSGSAASAVRPLQYKLLTRANFVFTINFKRKKEIIIWGRELTNIGAAASGRR